MTWGQGGQYDNHEYTCSFAATCVQNDLGLVKLGSAAPPPDWNEYLANGTSVIDIVGASPKSYQLIGEVVCRNGATTGKRCGDITRKPEVVSFAQGLGTYKYRTVEVAVDSDGGDSGAGYYWTDYEFGVYKRYAYGVHTSSTDDGQFSYYYAWSIGFYASPDFCDLWDLQICTTAGCPL